jgi:hypothetical protein
MTEAEERRRNKSLSASIRKALTTEPRERYELPFYFVLTLLGFVTVALVIVIYMLVWKVGIF